LILLVLSAGNGEIDFDEFLKMMLMKPLGKQTREDELKEAFNVLDIDGDGYITASELAKVAKSFGEDIDKDTLNLMIEGVDKDGDGEIDFSGSEIYHLVYFVCST
jgi:calcium-binding protein CML